jgi:16S rRNA G966 N2-methylase RsmD
MTRDNGHATALAIPQPAHFSRLRFEQALPDMLRTLDELDDVEAVLEAQARAAALEEYLARRGEDLSPAQRFARMAEVRIGELLGPPENGRTVAGTQRLERRRRYEFRLMATYRAVVEKLGGASRAEVLRQIERHVRRQANGAARMVVAAGAGDTHGQGWALLAGELAKRAHDVGAGSVDLIVTDPPYAAQDLDLWEELALHAIELLRPQAILVALTGQILLPDVILTLGSQLDWGWAYCQPLPGASSRIVGRHIGQEWKPWLAFSNGAWPSGRVGWHPDMLNGVPLAKTRYHWEQTTGPALQLIEALCPAGGVVLDPFCGTGTYGVAALTAGRLFVGIEPDGERLEVAAKRLGAVK